MKVQDIFIDETDNLLHLRVVMENVCVLDEARKIFTDLLKCIKQRVETFGEVACNLK